MVVETSKVECGYNEIKPPRQQRQTGQSRTCHIDSYSERKKLKCDQCNDLAKTENLQIINVVIVKVCCRFL